MGVHYVFIQHMLLTYGNIMIVLLAVRMCAIIFNKCYCQFKKQVIRVKKTRGAAAPRTRITCELFGKPKNAVCI